MCGFFSLHGQNFIKDQNICEKIVNLITIKNNFIIEIGPGYGNLTDFILNGFSLCLVF